MHALITGVAGQDGTLLCAELLSRGWQVTGTKLPQEVLSSEHPLFAKDSVSLDVTNPIEVADLLALTQPNVIFHLAGISSVSFSFKNPEITTEVNVGGTNNFLTALREQGLTKTHFIHAASTEIYDAAAGVITEQSKLNPRSPYAESKAQAYLACISARDAGFMVANAVLSNHESPLRTTEFVTGKIANGVALIHLALAETISLGNIAVEKDWSSASDIVLGLIAIADQNYIGDVILASGKSTSLTDFIAAAFSAVEISDWQSRIAIDENLLRANEADKVQIDPSKAREVLGWQASTPLSQWVGEMVFAQVKQIRAAGSVG